MWIYLVAATVHLWLIKLVEHHSLFFGGLEDKVMPTPLLNGFCSKIIFVKKKDGRVTSTVYQQVLQKCGLPVISDIMGDDFIYNKIIAACMSLRNPKTSLRSAEFHS